MAPPSRPRLWPATTRGPAGKSSAPATSTATAGDNPGPSWHLVGPGDFNGDGVSDLLWQQDSGQAAIWLMNGTAVQTKALVGDNPGTSWHLVGAGDFNGDGCRTCCGSRI